MMRDNGKTAEPWPPSALNLAVLAAASLAAVALLWCASHAGSLWITVAAAIGFSFINNTVFSLLHEAVHGLFHDRKWINDAAGWITAAFFVTSFSVQGAFHLTHHRNNRSEFEQFDYLRPGDNRFLKYAQWYAILTGLYWVFAPAFCLVYAAAPDVLRQRWLRDPDTRVGYQTGSAAYLAGVESVSIWRVRLEVLFTLSFQALLFLAFDLSLEGWLICYAFFAVNWSSLQYADHAWSPLDYRDGAWNLRVNPLVKLLFLNYHDHLAHHQNPQVPWLYLPDYVDADIPRPSYLEIYIKMWRGPRKLENNSAAGHEIADV